MGCDAEVCDTRVTCVSSTMCPAMVHIQQKYMYVLVVLLSKHMLYGWWLILHNAVSTTVVNIHMHTWPTVCLCVGVLWVRSQQHMWVDRPTQLCTLSQEDIMKILQQSLLPFMVNSFACL